MWIFLDECLPRRLKAMFTDHEVQTVLEMGWAGLEDMEIVRRAGRQFDVFVTIDRSFHLLKLSPSSVMPLAVIILRAPTNRFEDLQPLMQEVHSMLSDLSPGQVAQIS